MLKKQNTSLLALIQGTEEYAVRRKNLAKGKSCTEWRIWTGNLLYECPWSYPLTHIINNTTEGHLELTQIPEAWGPLLLGSLPWPCCRCWLCSAAPGWCWWHCDCSSHSWCSGWLAASAHCFHSPGLRWTSSPEKYTIQKINNQINNQIKIAWCVMLMDCGYSIHFWWSGWLAAQLTALISLTRTEVNK